MALHPRPQVVNPLLGIYFGIFAACLVAIVLLLLILEQLGTTDASLRRLMLVGTLVLFGAIGAIGYCTIPRDFFLAGRRVPAVLNGISIAVAALGGTGLAAMTGTLFLIGFDALCLLLGLVAGLVTMLVLIAPFFRKFGSATVPGFLGTRFHSTTVRLTAAGIAAVPLLLLLIAELKLAALATMWLTQGSSQMAYALITVTLVAILAPGGIRSLAWSSAAESIAAVLAILVPAAIAAVVVTNLPLGQMSHGPVLRSVIRAEDLYAVTTPIAAPLFMELPGQGLQPILARYATPFSNIGSVAFVLCILALMAGIAGSPALVARTGHSPTVYETRKSLGWAVLIAGILVMTMSATAVFLRDMLMTHLATTPPEQWSGVLRPLIEYGLMGLDGQARTGSAQSFLYRRDGVLLILPVSMGFPMGLVHLIAAGVLAAALAAASSAMTQLSVIVSEDVISGPHSELQSPKLRLIAARGAIAGTAVLAGWLAYQMPGDPLDLMLSSLAVSGPAFFPVLLLAIWWKRTNALGALAGMITGFAISAIALLAYAVEAISLPPILLSTLAALLAIGATTLVTKLTPAPSRHMLELVRDLRVPGGEAVQDRESRLLLQRERQRRSG